MDVWERWERIEHQRMIELIESLRDIPTELRDLSDKDISKVIDALRKAEQLPAEFN